MYAVRIIKMSVWGTDRAHCIHLEYPTSLPFVPVPHIGLDLDPDNERNNYAHRDGDCERAREVDWLTCAAEFVVRVGEYRSDEPDISRRLSRMFAAGWRVHFTLSHASRADALECIEDDVRGGYTAPPLVGLRGRWYTPSPDELLALRLSGEPFTEG